MDFSGLNTVKQVCEKIGQVMRPCPVCVETGTMYAISEENLVHTTTNNILKHICRPNGGKLFSLDIDKEHQYIARSVCCGDDCVYVLGDSIVSLGLLNFELSSKDCPIDVLWLDSKEFDIAHTVNEYNAIKGCLNKKGHFVMVDDIHNANSVKYKEIVPILKGAGYFWVEVLTPTGLFVSWVGYA